MNKQTTVYGPCPPGNNRIASTIFHKQKRLYHHIENTRFDWEYNNALSWLPMLDTPASVCRRDYDRDGSCLSLSLVCDELRQLFRVASDLRKVGCSV